MGCIIIRAFSNALRMLQRNVEDQLSYLHIIYSIESSISYIKNNNINLCVIVFVNLLYHNYYLIIILINDDLHISQSC